MSIPSGSRNTVSLQKNNTLPPELPPVDEYGDPLPQLLEEPNFCRVGTGFNWFTDAIALLRENFLMWVGIGLAFLLIISALSAIPVIGFIFSLMTPIFIGGIMQGSAAQERGEELKFEHLFAGFKTHLQPLIVLSLLYVVGIIMVFIPSVVISLLFFASKSILNFNSLSLGMIVAIVLPALLLMIALTFAMWCAPALIVLHDLSAISAMKKSFKGCMANLMPMLVYFLVSGICVLLCITLTLGIGVLVAFPVLMLASYTSYRDVWTDQPLSAST